MSIINSVPNWPCTCRSILILKCGYCRGALPKRDRRISANCKNFSDHFFSFFFWGGGGGILDILIVKVKYLLVLLDIFYIRYSLAKIGARALQRVHNTTYLIGSVPDLLALASGKIYFVGTNLKCVLSLLFLDFAFSNRPN